MIEKKPDSFPDIVDRAVNELRAMPAPPGPPVELLAVLLQAAGKAGHIERTGASAGETGAVEASGQSPSGETFAQPLSRLQKMRNIIMRNPLKSFATFAACCVVLISAYLIVSPMIGGGVAFAQVAEIIQKAKTMVCTGQMNLPDMSAIDESKIKVQDLGHGKLSYQLPSTGTTKIKIMSLENGRTRQETGTQVTITDWKAGKSLMLTPETKTAILTTMKGTPSVLQQDWLTSLKKITKASLKKDVKTSLKKDAKAVLRNDAEDVNAEELGLKTIDGREVKGFRLTSGGMTFTFWVDPKSGEPVTVETKSTIPDYTNLEIAKKGEELKTKGERMVEMVLSNFQFDVPLDESLFSLAPPDGYKLQEMSMDWSGASEKDVIEVLRRVAEMNDGAFPNAIKDQSLIMKLTMKMSFDMAKEAAKEQAEGKTKTFEPSPEVLKKAEATGNLMGRMVRFLTENKNWTYAGKGVKLGDADKPIFWFVPEGSKQGRVVYGDLSVRGVPLDKMPTAPGAEKGDAK
jgi:outer membrane lipoprotein-sorting protein